VLDVIDSPGDSSRHGLVHVRAVDGSVAANSHLLSARSAAA
jgi:hypothetical protein